MERPESRRLTYKVELAGGQNRLREMILYISKRSQNAPRWGKTKLNKTLWRADFRSFLERETPITGRAYQKLPQGPAPVEMAPVLGEMANSGLISFDRMVFSATVVEERVIALAEPNLANFSAGDLGYVDEAINHYWNSTASETSDSSHGIGWKSRFDGDPMPYELAFLSDEKLSFGMAAKLANLGAERGWKSE